MSKYKDLIESARSSDQKTGKPEQANLSIKIPKYLRRYWVSRAKAEGTTITAVIVEALENRFGKPD